MPLTPAAKALMLPAIEPNEMRLHSANPGTSGANELTQGTGYSRQAVAYDAASGGVRVQSAAVIFGFPAAEETATHASVWDTTIPACLGYAELSASKTGSAPDTLTVNPGEINLNA